MTHPRLDEILEAFLKYLTQKNERSLRDILVRVMKG